MADYKMPAEPCICPGIQFTKKKAPSVDLSAVCLELEEERLLVLIFREYDLPDAAVSLIQTWYPSTSPQ